MPKVSNTIDYSITPISFYRFCCNDVNITSCYVGHTANFIQRKYSHKNACNNPNSKKYNYKIYQTIRANGGWDNWNMIEIENKLCLSKRDSERYEQTLTEQLAADMNSHKAFRAETKAEYNKQYYQDHREERNQYQKQYKQDHQEEINKPIKCECSCVVAKDHLSRHQKTKKHISLMCVTI